MFHIAGWGLLHIAAFVGARLVLRGVSSIQPACST
jgi:hypothetical protein